MDRYSFDGLWPISLGDINESIIADLSEQDFQKLVLAVRSRSRKRGVSERKSYDIVRRLLRVRNKHRKHRLRGLRPKLLVYKYKNNPGSMLDGFVPNRSKRWITPSKRKLLRAFSLNNFSFVDAPRETMDALADIAKMECICGNANLNFDDNQLQDIAPYLVLGLLSQDMAPYIGGGRVAPKVIKVLDAVGFRDFLGMKRYSGKFDDHDLWSFPLRKRHATGKSTTTPGDSISFQKVADELVDTLNLWLGALPTPRKLSNSSMGKVSNIATETLNNAERHSRAGGDGDWYMAGFMARRPLESDDDLAKLDGLDAWYECHFAFLNLGRPIAEAVCTTPDATIKASLEKYISTHSRAFSKLGISESALATVFAMQDGISSKPENKGGVGMMEVIEVTNALAYDKIDAKKPRVTVISGANCVMFFDEFRSYYRKSELGKGRKQFFNPERSLDKPPSKNHVFDLNVNFPGTIVAVRFALDPNTMEAKHDDN